MDKQRVSREQLGTVFGPCGKIRKLSRTRAHLVRQLIQKVIHRRLFFVHRGAENTVLWIILMFLRDPSGSRIQSRHFDFRLAVRGVTND